MKKLIVFMFSIVLFGSCNKDNEGCTDWNATNYNSVASINDGSCVYEGCTDSTATNYYPIATIDDGSCQYVPTLSTTPVIYSGLPVETGGIISSDGGSAIIQRGVCWATTQNPTILDDITNNGSGTGSFSSVINNLEVNTYYLRAYAFNVNGVGYGDELSFTVEPEIGYTFQGGIIFYLDGNGGGLIAAPIDQSSGFGASWGCSGTLISGAYGTAIGTGAQNTIDIEAGCTTPGTAADICANLTLGGYSDWFLPSKDELNLMWINLADSDGDGQNTGTSDPNNLGGFSPTGYWSSTQGPGLDAAVRQEFNDGSQSNNGAKGYPNYVRAVRTF